MSNPILQKAYKVGSADLQGNRFVRFNNGTLSYATTPASHKAVGVIDHRGGDTGKYASVILVGVAEIETTGTVSAGDRVQCGTDGKAASHSGSNLSHGIALTTAAASGDVIQVLIQPQMQ